MRRSYGCGTRLTSTRLSPFAYYGIHDGLDLRQIPWRRGRGYDVDGLSNLYQSTDGWAKRVVKEVGERVDDVMTMRALGFCVSVSHAKYMARIFDESGIPAVAIWADTPAPEREAALQRLRTGDVCVVFSVDLFNEGVDVPKVDTLLLLRPTDSPLLFLQQLGRGLRRAEGKTVCTVLDFVGHHRKEFRFDRRLRALLPGSRKELIRQVEQGFPFLPAGCDMSLDRIAASIVLDNIRNSVPSRWPAKWRNFAVSCSRRATRVLTLSSTSRAWTWKTSTPGTDRGRTYARRRGSRLHPQAPKSPHYAERAGACSTSTTRSASPPTGSSCVPIHHRTRPDSTPSNDDSSACLSRR